MSILSPLSATGDSGHKRGILMRQFVVLSVFLALAALWNYTPLRQIVSVERLHHYADRLMAMPYRVPLLMFCYLAACLVFLPVTAVTVVCALALPLTEAAVAAIGGIVVSSSATYWAGSLIGPEKAKHWLGSIFSKVRSVVHKNVVLSVFVLRHLPVGPFTLVNIVLGSMHVSFVRFLIGNVVSVIPTLLVIKAVGWGLE